jgi:hypothetical protein
VLLVLVSRRVRPDERGPLLAVAEHVEVIATALERHAHGGQSIPRVTGSGSVDESIYTFQRRVCLVRVPLHIESIREYGGERE